MNHSLYYPLEDLNDRQSLFQIIRKGLIEDYSLTAYGLGPTQDDDEFRYPMSDSLVNATLNPIVIRYKEDLVSADKFEVLNIEPILTEDLIAYKLKEDWIFDKQRSERYVRIIGLAPIVNKYSEAGEIIGKRELFWLYFPECRYVFANCNAFNSHNDALHLSFDDVFSQRFFTSYVVKDDNVYNRSIESYSKGLDAILESERIKKEIFLAEHDLWNY